MGFFRRSSRQPSDADRATVESFTVDPTTMPALYHPDFIPPEPVDYGGHRDEVDAFIDTLGSMNRYEVAQVHRQGIASGATMSRRWAELEAQLVRTATEHGLEIGRVAAQHRADKASRSSPARAGNQHLVADHCAAVWAQVLVLRDHLELGVVGLAFEPWEGVLEPPEWMERQDSRPLD